jgi:hypothetical protein
MSVKKNSKIRNIHFTENIYFTNKVEVSQNEQGDRVNLLLLSAAMIILINATVGLIVAYPKFYVTTRNEKCSCNRQSFNERLQGKLYLLGLLLD